MTESKIETLQIYDCELENIGFFLKDLKNGNPIDAHVEKTIKNLKIARKNLSSIIEGLKRG